MTIRFVEHRIRPRQANLANGDLAVDLAQVAASAMQEMLVTAPGTVSLQVLLEELLIPAVGNRAPLTWQRDGVGVGTEMKRGFSGILGRFFARWYLETHHGFSNFVPISGPGEILSMNVVVRRNGQVDLPDWICHDAQGRLRLAEAKGSHDKSVWLGPGSAPPLKKAREQLEAASVQVRGATRPLSNRRVKGWGVASQWSTAHNALPPKLYVLDPYTEGEPLEAAEERLAAQDLQGIAIAQCLLALGHAALAVKLLPRIPDGKVLQLRRESIRAERGRLQQTDRRSDPQALLELPLRPAELAARAGQTTERLTLEAIQIRLPQLDGRRFLGGVVDRTGRLIPVPVSQLTAARALGPEEIYRTLFFAGFDIEILKALLAGTDAVRLQVPQAGPRPAGASGPWVASRSNGFVLAPLETIGVASPATDLA